MHGRSAQQVEVVSSLTNTMLPEFLKVPRPEWSKVRWINVQVRRSRRAPGHA
jgi:hypothetical protein